MSALSHPAHYRRAAARALESNILRNRVKDGKIKRSDQWRLDYLKLPYLTDCQQVEVVERFNDVQANLWRTDEAGRITFVDRNSFLHWMALGTHVMEELQLRGGIPANLPTPPQFPIISHPAAPTGVRILRDRPLEKRACLIKLAKKEHAEALLHRGQIRISPASFYTSPALGGAVSDDEMSFTISIAEGERLDERIGDQPPKKSNGRVVPKSFRRRLVCDDFYMYCMTWKYDYRLLDDFKYDAMVVIYDVKGFADKLSAAVRKLRPELMMATGKINYADPYYCATWQLVPGFTKHLKFAYQHEWRFTWAPTSSNQPFTIELGPLTSMGVLYTL